MNLLLDTHIVIWSLEDDPRLSSKARRLLEDNADSLWVSVVSLWEMALKRARSASRLAYSPTAAAGMLTAAGAQLLNLGREHVTAYEQLPPTHPDPFDRMLIAQALAESLVLITHDGAVARYSKTFILV